MLYDNLTSTQAMVLDRLLPESHFNYAMGDLLESYSIENNMEQARKVVAKAEELAKRGDKQYQQLTGQGYVKAIMEAYSDIVSVQRKRS